MAEKIYLDEEELERIVSKYYNDRFKEEAEEGPTKEVKEVEFSFKRSDGVSAFIEWGEPIDYEVEESYNDLDFETLDHLLDLEDGGDVKIKVVFEEE